MKLKVEVTASVLYTCFLSEKDSDKVVKLAKKIAKKHCDDDYDDYMGDAILDLYSEGKLDLYEESQESDFSTEDIESWEEVKE